VLPERHIVGGAIREGLSLDGHGRGRHGEAGAHSDGRKRRAVPRELFAVCVSTDVWFDEVVVSQVDGETGLAKGVGRAKELSRGESGRGGWKFYKNQNSKGLSCAR
jgi:hypothetical protein